MNSAMAEFSLVSTKSNGTPNPFDGNTLLRFYHPHFILDFVAIVIRKFVVGKE